MRDLNTYIRIKDWKEMRTYLFTEDFRPINHRFEETVVETGGKFSIIYILITFFVNKVWLRIA